MDQISLKHRLLSEKNTETNDMYRQRTHKFKRTHALYVIYMFAIATLQFIAIAFFTKGFLLTRNVLDDVSIIDSAAPPKFEKMVILVVDALRFDFVIPIDTHSDLYNDYYHNNLDVLYKSFDNTVRNPDKSPSSLLLKFMADPPTTTLQRLKGLTTGSLPTFIDAGSNFDGSVIEEDNIIKQMYLQNKTVYFAGDDTWDALFHPFLSNQSVPYESLNVWDLDTVDNGVIQFFQEQLIANAPKPEWDILIGHMLGIDHAGHKYGPNHFTMKDKQIQVNEFIKQIINAIDDSTLLVVLGDHGMDQMGNHGGDSPSELQSTLFLYSKKPNCWSIFPNAETVYDISHGGSAYREVNQIDLVPTLSLMLGLPIPFNNLGWPLREVAKSKNELERFYNSTLTQLQTYIKTSKIITKSLDAQALNQLSINASTSLLEGGPLYQQKLLQICRDLWAKFDYWSISTGIILLTISLVILIITTKLIPSIVVSQMIPELVPLVILLAFVSNLCFFGIFYVFQQPAFVGNWLWCSLLATAIGIIIGCFIPIFDRYSMLWIVTKFIGELSDYWSRIGAGIILIHALLFTSNSFTIWEDKIVTFLLVTTGILTLYEFIFVPNRQSTSALLTGMAEKRKKELAVAMDDSTDWDDLLNDTDSLPLSKTSRILGGYHSVMLIVCTRLASLITICREEQGEYCTPTFITEANNSKWALGICFAMSGIVPEIIKGYYKVSSSYRGAAPIWIKYLLRGFLFTNCIYWTLNRLGDTASIDDFDITATKLTIARILIGVGLVAANIGWWVGPLCIELKIGPDNGTTGSNQASILGIRNVYGSQYFLVVLNVLMCSIIFNKPLAQLSLYLMCNQILSIVEIVDMFKLKQSIIGPAALSLLAYQQFFTTGHQATIPSVQWDVGFILSKNIVFPITHIGIFFNTFGPHLIAALSIALLTFWNQPPDILKPQTLLARITSNCGTLLIYNTILCLSSFIWVTHFRRHLMVWKIFCPRFLFSCLSLIVTQLAVVFGTVAFASGKLIRQVNELFWA